MSGTPLGDSVAFAVPLRFGILKVRSATTRWSIVWTYDMPIMHHASWVSDFSGLTHKADWVATRHNTRQSYRWQLLWQYLWRLGYWIHVYTIWMVDLDFSISTFKSIYTHCNRESHCNCVKYSFIQALLQTRRLESRVTRCFDLWIYISCTTITMLYMLYSALCIQLTDKT